MRTYTQCKRISYACFRVIYLYQSRGIVLFIQKPHIHSLYVCLFIRNGRGEMNTFCEIIDNDKLCSAACRINSDRKCQAIELL